MRDNVGKESKKLRDVNDRRFQNSSCGDIINYRSFSSIFDLFSSIFDLLLPCHKVELLSTSPQLQTVEHFYEHFSCLANKVERFSASKIRLFSSNWSSLLSIYERIFGSALGF